MTSKTYKLFSESKKIIISINENNLTIKGRNINESSSLEELVFGFVKEKFNRTNSLLVKLPNKKIIKIDSVSKLNSIIGAGVFAAVNIFIITLAIKASQPILGLVLLIPTITIPIAITRFLSNKSQRTYQELLQLIKDRDYKLVELENIQELKFNKKYFPAIKNSVTLFVSSLLAILFWAIIAIPFRFIIFRGEWNDITSPEPIAMFTLTTLSSIVAVYCCMLWVLKKNIAANEIPLLYKSDEELAPTAEYYGVKIEEIRFVPKIKKRFVFYSAAAAHILLFGLMVVGLAVQQNRLEVEQQAETDYSELSAELDYSRTAKSFYKSSELYVVSFLDFVTEDHNRAATMFCDSVPAEDHSIVDFIAESTYTFNGASHTTITSDYKFDNLPFTYDGEEIRGETVGAAVPSQYYIEQSLKSINDPDYLKVTTRHKDNDTCIARVEMSSWTDESKSVGDLPEFFYEEHSE